MSTLTGKITPLEKPKNGSALILDRKHINWLVKNQDANRTEMAAALGVSRSTLFLLLKRYVKDNKETKEERRLKRLDRKVKKATKKEEEKIIKQEAKKIAEQKRRTIIDRLADPVRAKDGTPLTYNGETLDTMSALDLSLINQAKENPGANISLRALKLGIELQEERQRDREQMAKILPKLRTQAEREAQRQRQSFLDKGVWTDMAQSALDAYQSDYLAFLIADYRWQLEGAPIYNRTATAQAQINQQPSMSYQARKDAAKAVKEALQKLRSDVASYYKLVSADTDETSPIALMIEQMNNL